MKELKKRFNEREYLTLNADVADAGQNKKAGFGWTHFLLYGGSERRQGIPHLDDSRDKDFIVARNVRTAEPPAQLRTRVHGKPNLADFRMTGKGVACDLELALDSVAHTLLPGSKVLDFGCGCGRVLSWFEILHPDWEFYGTDIDGEAIEWCKSHLESLAQFQQNESLPPLAYPDSFFDFVFSVSIFTHLPEPMQDAWLAELNRIAKPGALVMASIHGAKVVADALYIPDLEKREFEETGFYYRKGTETPGLPEFYQTAYHTESYVYPNWGKFFKVIDVVPQGIASFQDLVILQKRLT